MLNPIGTTVDSLKTANSVAAGSLVNKKANIPKLITNDTQPEDIKQEDLDNMANAIGKKFLYKTLEAALMAGIFLGIL